MTDEKTNYPRDWAAYTKAQSWDKDYFLHLLVSLCAGLGDWPGGIGRPRVPLRDVVIANAVKVYVRMSYRRSGSDWRDCAAKDVLSRVPSHTTASRYMCDPRMVPVHRALLHESAAPFSAWEKYAGVDSTGFGLHLYDRWVEVRPKNDESSASKKEAAKRAKKRAKYSKAHVLAGTQTHAILDLIVRGGNSADAPMLPALLESTVGRFDLREVTGDKAYASYKNIEAIEKIGAKPYLMFRENMTGAGGPSSWRRAYHLFMAHEEEFMQSYGQRQNVESVFSAVKRRLGGHLASRKIASQMNELYLKAICHNLWKLTHAIFDVGLKPVFWPDQDQNVA